jgi:hypothetical protein
VFEEIRPRRRAGVEQDIPRIQKHENWVSDFRVVQAYSISLAGTDGPSPETVRRFDKENPRLNLGDGSAKAVMHAGSVDALRGGRSSRDEDKRHKRNTPYQRLHDFHLLAS